MKQCARCGTDLPEPTRPGPKRLYCGDRCRQMAYKVRKLGRDPHGAYRRSGQREVLCANGLHDISTPDKRAFVGKVHEQCKKCYLARNKRKRTIRPGYCRKHLHPLSGENAGFRLDNETYYCRACVRESRRVRKELGYRLVRCAAYGCKRYVERGPLNLEPYRCPAHRQRLGIAA